jgi:hypothetical protein
MSERLSAFLRAERVVPVATIEAAVARQRVYGGGLDTALLEMGALSEPALWTRLAAVSGLPMPSPEVADGSAVSEPPALGAEQTLSLRAVPVGERDGVLGVLCAEPVAAEDIRHAAAERGLQAKLYIVPETRLLAVRQRVYGETLPQRYAPLLARAMGTTRARKSFARPRPARPPRPAPETTALAAFDEAPDAPAGASLAVMLDSALTPLERVLNLASPSAAGRAAPEPDFPFEDEDGLPMFLDSGGIPVGVEPLSLIADESEPVRPVRRPTAAELLADSATEALCRRVRDRGDKGRALALRVLRGRLEHPRALALLGELRQEAAGTDASAATQAIETLCELRDEGAIPIFIHRLRQSPEEVAAAAQRALVALTAHGFTDPEQWGAWWLENAWSPRTAWLLAGLGDADAETRRRAFQELRPLSEDTRGYDPDLPVEEREAARRRWIEWWQARGGADLADADAYTVDISGGGQPG